MLLIPPLPVVAGIDALSFSGGVSEYLYGNETAAFGDLGPQLARHVRERVEEAGLPVEQPIAGGLARFHSSSGRDSPASLSSRRARM